jgi:hypothetical protein
MLLAAILFLCPFPQTVEVEKVFVDRPASLSTVSTNESSFPIALPSAPDPKIQPDAEMAGGTVPTDPLNVALQPLPLATVEPASPAQPAMRGNSPLALKPATTRSYETPRLTKIRYTLMFASSGAAGFDAWSTRRAISQGYGTEANPMLRPFAHSGALYAATQVSPLVMDYLGHRMMTSRHRVLRQIWWLPQSAGTGISLAAGVRNMGVVP